VEDFFKYIAISEEDKTWGLFLNVAGKSGIAPHLNYPPKEHPAGYYFSWQHGRILREFQLNYITEGHGILENNFGKFQIIPGTLMITRPGVWHRYRPLLKTGWVEHYIGFDGELAHHFLNNPLILQEQSIIQCGIREEFIDTYYKIFDIVQKEEPGFQQIASGLVIKLLGYLVAIQKQQNFSGKPIEKIIQQARFQMREHVERKLDINHLAASYHIGYSYFRKMFKKYTGISPHQYQLELKIMRAKELIITSNKSIKEISFELGFQSIHYFSRLFKKKVGLNPSNLR
jgi:AraC-like DNA-binding protein